MKTKDLLKLPINSIVGHKHFRKVKIEEFLFCGSDLFGVKIQPIYHKEKLYLSNKTGCPYGTPFLESSVRAFI